MLACLELLGVVSLPTLSLPFLSRLTGSKMFAHLGIYLIIVWGAFVSAHGQAAPQTLTIPQPTTSGTLGRVDAGALAEVTAHFAAIGAVPWTGMQGTGQITYTSDQTPYSATLTIVGNTGFRLDAVTQRGQASTRINGNVGAIQLADGSQNVILPDTAASGIFQFQLPRLAKFPGPQSSLLDQGMVVVDGQTLHRLTFQFSAVAATAVASKPWIIATDLYFHPTTHLLVKSVNTIRINGARNQDFIREITYGDYRQVGSSLVPFRYSQMLSGQKQWTLQLSDVQLNPTVQNNYFEF